MCIVSFKLTTVKNNFKMLSKIALVFITVYLTSSSDVILLVSSTQSFIATYPRQSVPVIQSYYARNKPNIIGNNAQTIGYNNMGYLVDFIVVFQGLFYSSCPDENTTLVVQADDSFIALLNDKPVAQGTGADTVFKFKITPQCGLNNLTITVINDRGPDGFTLSVSQNQEGCYKCGANAFFNPEYCKCQCNQDAPCSNPLQRWSNVHPNCGCSCINKYISFCGENQYFDDLSCRCQCLPILCSPKKEQDPVRCECRCKAEKCPEGQSWSYSRCACVRKTCHKCSSNSEFDCSQAMN